MPRFLSSPIALILALALLGIVAVHLARTISGYMDLRAQEKKLRGKAAYFETENQKVREELRIANTPEAVERDAKARLNLKRPGEEVVVVVPNNEPATSTARDNSPWRNFKDLIKSLLTWDF